MSRSLRIGVLATHPIQYFAPLYRALAADPEVDLTVYFAHRPTPEEQGIGFGVAFEWDVDLTGGFRHEFLRNVASRPNLQSFGGCDTPEIGERIRRERFDAFLVSGWNTKSYWQGMLACWRSGTPVMVRGDSQLGGPASPARALAKRLVYPRFIGRFDACLAVGERSAEYFRHYGARRVVRSPHFVDNDAFAARAAAARESRAAIRRAWGIPETAFVPLFAAKFIEKKRPMDVLRALADGGRSDVHGLFVGDGELRAACEAYAREAPLRASFAGFLNQTEIARAYAAADVLVLPSDHRETWGLVVNEAMASGLPAIVSEAVGCSPDLVVPGRTGMTVPLGDVGAIARAISSLAADRGLAAALGRGAAEHVRDYSVEAAAAGVREGARIAARGSTAAVSAAGDEGASGTASRT